MKKYLIATHGQLAEGFKSSVRIIAGDYYADQLNTITAFMDASDFTQEIRRFIDELGEDEQGVIFTDLYGGSVNQNATLAKVTSGKDVVVITGTNLGLLMEIVLNPSDRLEAETIANALELGKNEIAQCPKEETADTTEDEFF